MRILFALLLCFLLVPHAGCGGGRPDPRDHPDFVDDTDPSVAGEMVPKPGSEGAQQPAAAPKEQE
jgi:hypothetical protein